MRRPARRLFTLCSAASLVLLGVTAAAHSRGADSLSYLGRHVQHGVRIDGNVLALAIRTSRDGDDPGGWQFSLPEKDHPLWWDQSYFYQRPSHGFHATRSTGPDGSVTRMLYLPMWLLAVCFGILPAAWVVSWVVKHGRTTSGVCVSCGYDLRATPDRCPECGTGNAP